MGSAPIGPALPRSSWWCRLLAVLPVLVLGTGCYTVQQAAHQNDLFNTRRPVAQVLQDPATPVPVRKALTQSRRILAYGERQGLAVGGAYGYFIATPAPVVSYLVQAAQADRLEAFTWWFPIVGEVPYLGFFDRADRDGEAARLQSAGLDVYRSGAGAFSSLGWFDDPLFSSMLRRDEPELAHLLLHELTHRTLWIAGQPGFNENLAEYIATRLTPNYLMAVGQGAKVGEYLKRRQDRSRFHAWLKSLKAELETLYASRPKRSPGALKEAKAAIFARYQAPPLRPRFELDDHVGGVQWNNAAVLAASLYAPESQRFETAFNCVAATSSGESVAVRRFLEALRLQTASGAEPFMAMAQLCTDDRVKARLSRRGGGNRVDR